LRSANQPNEVFAVATALSVIGTLIGRRIAGPTFSATHSLTGIIGPTASGKEHARSRAKAYFTAVGAAGAIGPGRWKSGVGMIRALKARPCQLSIQDELGALFAKLADPRAQSHEKDINSNLRELWGINWGRYDSDAGADEASIAINAPALSVLGMTTRKELFKACRSRDVANGFLTRWIFKEIYEVPDWNEVPAEVRPVPAELKTAMHRIYLPHIVPDPEGNPPVVLPWASQAARELFYEINARAKAEPDETRGELLRRSGEKVMRVATCLACEAPEVGVDLVHMQWADAYIAASNACLIAGLDEYMEEDDENEIEFRRRLLDVVKSRGGAIFAGDLGKAVQNRVKRKALYDASLGFLLQNEMLIASPWKPAGAKGGRPSTVLRLPGIPDTVAPWNARSTSTDESDA
jgi:hypothetical protein